jgi:hypothetical protein
MNPSIPSPTPDEAERPAPGWLLIAVVAVMALFAVMVIGALLVTRNGSEKTEARTDFLRRFGGSYPSPEPAVNGTRYSSPDRRSSTLKTPRIVGTTSM